jgi:hypothetical protein
VKMELVLKMKVIVELKTVVLSTLQSNVLWMVNVQKIIMNVKLFIVLKI